VTRARLVPGLLAGGLVYGALCYGAPLSLLHVAVNRVASVRDAAVTLAACVLLYGAASAALFLAAGLPLALVGGGRASAMPATAAPRADARLRRGLAAGVFAVTFLFWFRYCDIALTYDEVPITALRTLPGMLAWVAARGVVIALAALLVARLLAAPLAGRWRSPAGRGALALAVAVAAAHLALPPYFAHAAAARAVARRMAPLPTDVDARATGVDVVLVGLDGADWRVAKPLLAAGGLPTLARLMREGVSAPLATLTDANSAVIWASIATGQPVAVHGIRDFDRLRLAGMSPPGIFALYGTYLDNFGSDLERLGLADRHTVIRESLAAIPLWEVLDAAGVSIGLVDAFFYSYPAFVPRDPRSYILAHGVASAYRRLTARGATPDAATLAAWMQPASLLAQVAPDLDRPETEWQIAATLDLLDQQPRPRFFHVYTHEPDWTEHRYWKWYQPEYFLNVDAADVARFGTRIPDVYRRLDAFLGALLARVGPDTVVIVCSDHGHSPTILHPQLYSFHEHGPPGILVMAGGPVAPGAQLRAPHVLDLFPTVLYLLGLPVPDDVPGRVLTEALAPEFVARTPLAHVRSYEPLGRRPAAGLDSAEHSAAEIEKLRAIGYIQ
jgi:Type I phosphodiesterase / nucleotide pyrophosphatase